MKRILIVLSFILVVLCAKADEHLSFKGIPIEGNINSFCQKLRAKGFIQSQSTAKARIFVGDFTGKDATIRIIADQSGENVYSVVVIFPSLEEWKSLVNTYDYYKDLYTEKYGAPTYLREYNPSYRDSNTALMYQLYQGTVEYKCVFKAPGGTIEICIEKAENNMAGVVLITYSDSQNIDNKRQLDLDEI